MFPHHNPECTSPLPYKVYMAPPTSFFLILSPENIYICLQENSFRRSMRTGCASLEREIGEYVISDKSLFNVGIILNT
jgi:hypothetical protein